MEDTAVEKSRADVIMERKLRLVKEQASIVLSPKMRDLHLLTQILFTTDKTINRMRMNAGTVRMPLFELEEANERITRFTSKVRAFTSALGDTNFYMSPGSSPAEKEILARRRNAYVFMPKTSEGAALANIFISLDSAYCEFKIKSPLQDIRKLGEAIDTMKEIVREFRDLTSDLAAKAQVRFVEPEGLAGYLKTMPDDERSVAGEEA
jgi:hypothetical protein